LGGFVNGERSSRPYVRREGQRRSSCRKKTHLQQWISQEGWPCLDGKGEGKGRRRGLIKGARYFWYQYEAATRKREFMSTMVIPLGEKRKQILGDKAGCGMVAFKITTVR